MKEDVKNIISDLTKKLASLVISKSFRVGTTQYNDAIEVFENCLNNYLINSFSRYETIKTLLYRDRPVDLKDHYVPTDFKLGNDDHISGTDVFEYFKTNKRNVVIGTAGSGKSVLLRRLFIDIIENNKGYVPILLELRLLITPERNHSIITYIHKTFADMGEGFTENQLNIIFKEGNITLFLDGFDEIDFDHKVEYEREILEISHKFPNILIVIASRPDDCFSSWGDYHTYRALPLNKDQSIDMISRIEYDTTVKNKFIQELNEGLYEKHTDFLSNPLLLTMMLLTYEQLAEIPEKIHIFYEQAFDTLYHKHDALKELYKRKSYSGLPIDDFKKIFSAFCMVTYSDRKISFSYNEIIDYIKKSIEIEGFNIQTSQFFNDLIKSVCIIQKDGIIYTFSHRSFQEYFAAHYISNTQSINIRKILDKMSTTHISDNIIQMLFELNKEKVETNWVIPRLKNILDKIEFLDCKKDLAKICSEFYSSLSINNSRLGLMLNQEIPDGYFMIWLSRLYKDENELVFSSTKDEDAFDKDTEESAELVMRNTSLRDNEELPFKDIPHDAEWLSQTWLLEHCDKQCKLISIIYEKLAHKYEEKEKSLTSILFD